MATGSSPKQNDELETGEAGSWFEMRVGVVAGERRWPTPSTRAVFTSYGPRTVERSNSRRLAPPGSRMSSAGDRSEKESEQAERERESEQASKQGVQRAANSQHSQSMSLESRAMRSNRARARARGSSSVGRSSLGGHHRARSYVRRPTNRRPFLASAPPSEQLSRFHSASVRWRLPAASRRSSSSRSANTQHAPLFAVGALRQQSLDVRGELWATKGARRLSSSLSLPRLLPSSSVAAPHGPAAAQSERSVSNSATKPG